jgi:hypothetical protein
VEQIHSNEDADDDTDEDGMVATMNVESNMM